MNTNELAARLADTHGIDKAKAKAIVEDAFKSIVSVAVGGTEVSLPGFGKFKIKDKPAREGRSPATGEPIKIAASKKLAFAPAKSVRDLING